MSECACVYVCVCTEEIAAAHALKPKLLGPSSVAAAAAAARKKEEERKAQDKLSNAERAVSPRKIPPPLPQSSPRTARPKSARPHVSMAADTSTLPLSSPAASPPTLDQHKSASASLPAPNPPCPVPERSVDEGGSRSSSPSEQGLLYLLGTGMRCM